MCKVKVTHSVERVRVFFVTTERAWAQHLETNVPRL